MNENNGAAYIDRDELNDITEEQLNEFAEKVLYHTGLDTEKREISIIIPKNNHARKLFAREEIEADIIEKIRPLIRDLL